MRTSNIAAKPQVSFNGKPKASALWIAQRARCVRNAYAFAYAFGLPLNESRGFAAINRAPNAVTKDFMQTRLQHFAENRFAVPLILAVFGLSIALQWNGSQSVAVADEVGYVVGGVNLITTGSFTNSFGEPELWFPPVYPVLIGICSLGGWIDPFVVARVLSVIAAVATLLILHRTIERLSEMSEDEIQESRHRPSRLSPQIVAFIATALLATNPTFQIFANRALSESLALCLSLLGLSVWLRGPQTLRNAAVGAAVIGLAALTRPECLLVLPLWSGIDWLRRRDFLGLQRGLIAGVVLAAMLLPYAAYLRTHTGRWTISNKSEVNLAAGRAAFHQTPREYIDEVSLRMGYFPVESSLTTELKRFQFNGGKLVAAYSETYFRPTFAVVFGLLMLAGAVELWRRGQSRIVLCLLAGLPYLAVVAVYDVGGPKNLHLALPAFTWLAAVGIATSLQSRRWVLALPTVAVIGLLMFEGTTRYPRWVRSESFAVGSGLREAGLRLRATQPPRGAMYEFGATAAYYSGMERRYLTPNRLDTVLAFIDRHEAADTVVYLTVSSTTQKSVHATTNELLAGPLPRLEPVLEVDSPERVVIYRVIRGTQSLVQND